MLYFNIEICVDVLHLELACRQTKPYAKMAVTTTDLAETSACLTEAATDSLDHNTLVKTDFELWVDEC